jgi:hypothetical protein
MRQGVVVSRKKECARDLLFREKGHAPRTFCFGKKGKRQRLVVSGKRACAKDLLFEREDRHLGLVASGKRACAKDLLFEGEDRRLGLVASGNCLRLHIPDSTRSFQAKKRVTSATEVCVSSLDIVGSNLF